MYVYILYIQEYIVTNLRGNHVTLPIILQCVLYHPEAEVVNSSHFYYCYLFGFILHQYPIPSHYSISHHTYYVHYFN